MDCNSSFNRKDRNTRRTFVFVFASVVTVQWHTVGAYDWNNDYGTTVSVGYDDNFRLSESNKISTTTVRLGVFANLAGTTEISNLRFTVGANSNTHSESSIEDSDTYKLSLDTSRRGERLSGSLRVALDSQSTTETELLDSGTTRDGSRDTVSISPGFSYQVNERNTFSVNLSLRDVTYDTVSLTDYSDNSVALSWGYILDETSDISINLLNTDFDPEQGDKTESNSLFAGYNVRVSEATSYNFSIGYSDVDRPSNPEDGRTFSVAVTHSTDERNSFAASLSNSYQSSGLGDVRNEDNLTMQWTHALSDRSGLNVTAQAISTEDRDYATLQFGNNYQYTREVSLAASLRYRQQESDTVDADSSSIFFSLSYSPI